jgi:tetratricopeptide (TPR) repeat protein
MFDLEFKQQAPKQMSNTKNKPLKQQVMKTLINEQKTTVNWNVEQQNLSVPKPKIGDDDGISDRAMNVLIVLFALLTLGISIASAAPANDEVKYRILLRQAMLDMDRLEYEKAIVKLLDVRANTDENANVNQMLGICYLYGRNDAEKAVFYFNRAAEHATIAFEEWDLDENRAPIQTLYHLGKAYEQLNDMAKAAQYYTQYLALLEIDPLAAKSRTFAMIKRNANECYLAAQKQTVQTENNVVLNK